jgi:hypothetical protein
MSDTENAVETKKEKAAKAQRDRNAKRKKAFDLVLATAKEYLAANFCANDEEAQALKQALFDLRPMRSMEPVTKQSVQSMLTKLFDGRNVVTGEDCFKAFRAGILSSPDVRKYLTLAVKTGAPEKRMWIEYNGKEDEYLLRGVGPTAPIGWTGYTPVDQA